MHSLNITKLPKSKIEISVQLPAADFEPFVQKAADEFAAGAEIEGFRKGMAPAELVKQKVGSAKILESAARLAVEKLYPQIIEESKLEPLGYPQIELLKLAKDNPLEFKATITVMPELKLPDYKSMASETAAACAEVTQEEIKQIKMEKERRERERIRHDLIEKIASLSEFEVPEALVEAESQKMMEELKQKTPDALHMSFDEYLQKIKKTEQELYGQIFSENNEKIKHYFILQEIAKKENIEASAEEIEEAVKRVAEERKQEGLDFERLKEYYKDVVKTEKVFEFLESLYGNNHSKIKNESDPHGN